MLIEEGLVAHLAADGGVAALVAARIYPGAVPQSGELPAITYQLVSLDPGHTLGGGDGMPTARYQISAWGQDANTGPSAYASAKAIAEALRLALDGYRGDMGTVPVRACLRVSVRDLPDPANGVVQIASDYSITYEESTTP